MGKVKSNFILSQTFLSFPFTLMSRGWNDRLCVSCLSFFTASSVLLTLVKTNRHIEYRRERVPQEFSRRTSSQESISKIRQDEKATSLHSLVCQTPLWMSTLPDPASGGGTSKTRRTPAYWLKESSTMVPQFWKIQILFSFCQNSRFYPRFWEYYTVFVERRSYY